MDRLIFGNAGKGGAAENRHLLPDFAFCLLTRNKRNYIMKKKQGDLQLEIAYI